MAKEQTVTEVSIPLAAFRTLSCNERNALLAFAHASNEVGALLRVVMIAQNQPSVAPIYDLYATTQALTFQKVLAGKLYECWNLIAARYFSTGLGRVYDAKLHSSGQRGLAQLKRYFGRSTNIIAMIRNDAAFHYSRQDVSGDLDELAEEDCRVYLADKVTSALYLVGEKALYRHLLRQIDPDPNQAVQIMSRDLSVVGRNMGSFFVSVLLVLILAATERFETKGRMRRCRMRKAIEPRRIRPPIFLDTSADDAMGLDELLARANG